MEEEEEEEEEGEICEEVEIGLGGVCPGNGELCVCPGGKSHNVWGGGRENLGIISRILMLFSSLAILREVGTPISRVPSQHALAQGFFFILQTFRRADFPTAKNSPSRDAGNSFHLT